MSGGRRWMRRAVFGLVWLALFSMLYTAGETLGVWPQMAPGAFHDLDLAVGAAAVVALCAALLVGRRGSP